MTPQETKNLQDALIVNQAALVVDATPVLTDSIDTYNAANGAGLERQKTTLTSVKTLLLGSLISTKSIYKALLNQTGVADPVATRLEYTSLGIIVWTRTGVGVYIGTLVGIFTASKTFIMVNQNSFGNLITAERTSADVITVKVTTVAGVATDALLIDTEISIEVYP